MITQIIYRDDLFSCSYLYNFLWPSPPPPTPTLSQPIIHEKRLFGGQTANYTERGPESPSPPLLRSGYKKPAGRRDEQSTVLRSEAPLPTVGGGGQGLTGLLMRPLGCLVPVACMASNYRSACRRGTETVMPVLHCKHGCRLPCTVSMSAACPAL